MTKFELNGITIEFTEDGEIKLTNLSDIKYVLKFVDPTNNFLGYSNYHFNKTVWVKSNMSTWIGGPKIIDVILTSTEGDIKVRVYFDDKKFENLNIDNEFSNEKNKSEISIIISAYKTFDLLKDVIDLFVLQMNKLSNLNYEILVGVDGCYDTLEYVSNLNNSDNVKFYFSKENVGPYFMFNSLSKIAQYNNLLFFGADDIPKDNMIKTILTNLKTHDLVRFHFTEMYKGVNPDLNPKNGIGIGAFAIRKEFFMKMNGYYTWRTSSDAEFRMRAYSNKVKEIILDESIMYYRIGSGPTQLTTNSFSGYGSKLRDIYQKIIVNKQLGQSYTNPEFYKTVPLIRVY